MNDQATIKPAGRKAHIKFQVSLQILIVLILCLSSFGTLGTALSINRRAGTEKAYQLFSETGERVKELVNEQLRSSLRLAGVLTTLPGLFSSVETSGVDSPVMKSMMETLLVYPELYSLYVGFPDGNFVQVIHAGGNPLIIANHGAPEGTEFILRTIRGSDTLEGDQKSEYWIYLDSDNRVLGRRTVTEPDYNPVVRVWYEAALENGGEAVLSSAYVFNSLKEPGITASCEAGEGVVVGVDITLTGLKTFLNTLQVSPATGIIILDDQARILAANRGMEEWLQTSIPPLHKAGDIAGERVGFLLENEGSDEAASSSSLQKKYLLQRKQWETPGGQTFRIIIVSPASDFLGYLAEMQRKILLFTLLLLALIFPLTVFGSRSLSRFLVTLAKDAERIRSFDFDGTLPHRSFILEFQELTDAFQLMKTTIAARTKALEAALEKLERIIDIGISMTVETDSNRLVEMILRGAKELSHADGGSLYLKGEGDVLNFQIVMNDSLGTFQGGTSGTPVSMPPVALYRDGKPNLNNVVTCAYHTGRTIAFDDAYTESSFDFSGTRKFDEMNGYRSKSFLTVPLMIQGSRIIGALQLINCISPETGEVVSFDSGIQGFVEALGAEAAAVLYNRDLLERQKRLFESLIQLIAGAIDTKSPYTGAHCARVPELALMLAEEAEKCSNGPLADFHFSSPEDREAFRIAAWLHDCGKMTTPEFVVDKAVKLETLYNRIHEIRTRFEVLLRDLQLEEKEALLQGTDPAVAQKERKEKEAELFDDFAFVAQCNSGMMKLNRQKKERLKNIARRSWFRSFDKSLGLSIAERQRMIDAGVDTAPGRESLLIDGPEHIIPLADGRKDVYKDFDFIIPQPRHLYNRGELYNLSIESGTLTEEERFKINEHIMQTLVMLRRLPFPEPLSRVPVYAGSHHEKLNGEGYPRGLDESQLSYPERMMAIADIFEALTSSDRPYKTRNTLSEAVALLYNYKVDRHIDADLFDLFLTSGIYKTYAEQFLAPEQIDDVDIQAYLGPAVKETEEAFPVERI